MTKLGTDCVAGLTRRWYETGAPVPAGLRALAALYRGVVAIRRRLYLNGWRRIERLPVPVLVVGNISVGGTGKTPLVIALVEILRAAGFCPGVVSRGYGGRAKHWPQRVTALSEPLEVGDETVLIALRAGCPVMAGPDRVVAARALREGGCDAIVSDDGLQHYRLGRDVEIAVVDGARGLGNGLCLPAGPLREPPERLQAVDFVVRNGGDARPGEFLMRLGGNAAVRLGDGQTRPLASFAGRKVRALAGIGNPERFFDHLRAFGLDVEARAFPDHHVFRAEDLTWGEDVPLLMTEKDAVKCRAFSRESLWSVPVRAVLPPEFAASVLNLLRTQTHGRQTA
ncbi:MAG TPA: tetraacyldisaccharide 4'-kinase [Methylococcaceae bacterium]|nr:tetraacyldisaccharide 4'-kinase [Methylococcaceae bacterium]